MDETLNIVRKLKSTHENFTVGLGVTIGLILIAYFYSFASLIDRMHPGLVGFQVVTTVIFVVALFYIKRIAFFFTKLKLGRKQPYASAVNMLKSFDLDQDEKAIAAKLTKLTLEG